MQRTLATAAGTIVVQEDHGLLRAQGLTYGTADTFAAPRPVAIRTNPIDATRPGPACPQLPSRLDAVTGPIAETLRQSEDCLVLSVTAPVDACALPVMVWFHGGAYMSGGGESAKYDPGALAREGRVVVVNVTYRLGIFGYLTPEPISGEENLGLQDQILALRWVQANIAAFGGDPANVTAFGQSAGADSVLSLMLCEQADGLFHRAILQSAPLRLRENRDAMTSAMRRAVTDALSTSPHEATVEQLLTAQAAATTAAQQFGALGGLPFAPILGHGPLPSLSEVPARLADAASRVELLLGHTEHDAAPFVAMTPLAIALARLGVVGRAANRRVSVAVTERVFGAPARQLARTWSANGGQSATYRFDWAPSDTVLGACHCIELPFLFGAPSAWSDAPMLGTAESPIDERLATRMRWCWAQFAHLGVNSLESRSLQFP
ncbi:carboxylesterase family protein [Nocardia salmonicida]|uniref:carboxylesterase family protein n=1 Tax=Nocardia salmonicida TaxID=53431 RepID=UPI0036AD10EB